MGKLIESGNTENFDEKLFINEVQEYLDDTNINYWNRQVFGREFDICILMPGKGILVVKLKEWCEENILRIENNDSVIIRVTDGEESESPQKQAWDYGFPMNATFVNILIKFITCIKWSTCHRCLKLSLDIAVWMWSWRRSLPYRYYPCSNSPRNTNHVFSLIVYMKS